MKAHIYLAVALVFVGLGFGGCKLLQRVRASVQEPRRQAAELHDRATYDKGFYAGMRATLASIKVDGTNVSVDISDVLRYISYTNR